MLKGNAIAVGPLAKASDIHLIVYLKLQKISAQITLKHSIQTRLHTVLQSVGEVSVAPALEKVGEVRGSKIKFNLHLANLKFVDYQRS